MAVPPLSVREWKIKSIITMGYRSLRRLASAGIHPAASNCHFDTLSDENSQFLASLSACRRWEKRNSGCFGLLAHQLRGSGGVHI